MSDQQFKTISSTSYDPKSLLSRVQKSKSPCRCRDCKPTLYTDDKCKGKHGVPNAQSYEKHSTGKLFPRENAVRFMFRYEMTALAQITVDNINRTYSELTNEQKDALSQLKLFVLRHACRLNAKRCNMGVAKMKQLMNIFSDLFFFSTIPVSQIKFRWRKCSFKHLGAFKPGSNHLSMREDILGAIRGTRLLTRLSTLLHEMTHAYFCVLACWNCPWRDEAHGENGHGGVWQLVTLAIERAMLRLARLSVDMNRGPDLVHHIEETNKFPSLCELKKWNLLPESTRANRTETSESSSLIDPSATRSHEGGKSPHGQTRTPTVTIQAPTSEKRKRGEDSEQMGVEESQRRKKQKVNIRRAKVVRATTPIVKRRSLRQRLIRTLGT